MHCACSKNNCPMATHCGPHFRLLQKFSLGWHRDAETYLWHILADSLACNRSKLLIIQRGNLSLSYIILPSLEDIDHPCLCSGPEKCLCFCECWYSYVQAFHPCQSVGGKTWNCLDFLSWKALKALLQPCRGLANLTFVIATWALQPLDIFQCDARSDSPFYPEWSPTCSCIRLVAIISLHCAHADTVGSDRFLACQCMSCVILIPAVDIEVQYSDIRWRTYILSLNTRRYALYLEDV